MAIQEYLLDEAPLEWVESGGASQKLLADGLNGAPQAHVDLADEGFGADAHFHDVAQFFLTLEGTMTFSGHLLEAISVYYSDPYTAYGPFVTGPRNKMAVLRPAKSGHSLKGGIIWMSDREGRKLRNPYGREFYGQAHKVPWQDLTGDLAGIRRKLLFGQDDDTGPSAEILECPPNMVLQREAPPFGEYQILVEGSALLMDREIKPHSMRYLVGDEPPTQLASRPEGATWLILTYDQAAIPKPPIQVS